MHQYVSEKLMEIQQQQQQNAAPDDANKYKLPGYFFAREKIIISI